MRYTRLLACGHSMTFTTIEKHGRLRKRTRHPDRCVECSRQRKYEQKRAWLKAHENPESLTTIKHHEPTPPTLKFRDVPHVTVSTVQDLSEGKLERLLNRIVRGDAMLTRTV